MKFIFLDHPSDLKIQVFGKNQKELLVNAALAMMTFLYPKNVDIVNHETYANIRLKSLDTKSLLVDWLSELLYLSDTKNVCYNDFCFDKLSDEEIIAVAYGRRVKTREEIKAVTYDGLEIKQVEDGFEAMILFDI